MAVFTEVGDHDPSEIRNQKLRVNEDWRGTHVSAASARTFSRSWHAPPPLMEFRCASTLSTRKVSIIRARCNRGLSLVGSVNGDVDHGVLGDVTERETGHDDEFLRLETYEEDEESARVAWYTRQKRKRYK